MLGSDDLDVDVLVVVFVEGGDGEGVADPEVDGVGLGGERDSGEGDARGHVGGEEGVFRGEVVVF